LFVKEGVEKENRNPEFLTELSSESDNDTQSNPQTTPVQYKSHLFPLPRVANRIESVAMELQRAAAAVKRQSLAPPMGQHLASLTTSQADQSAQMKMAELEAAIAALLGKKQRLRESFDRLAARSSTQLPFTWDDLDAHLSSLHASISLRFIQLQALQASRPAVSVLGPAATRGDESIKEEDEEMVRNDEDPSPVPVNEVEKDLEDKKVHAPDAGNPMFQQPYTAYQIQPELQRPRTTNLPMLQQQEYPVVGMEAPKANNNVPMVQQPYMQASGKQEFPQVISQAPMVMDHVLQQQYIPHHQPYHPVEPSNNNCHPPLRQQHKAAESGIQKDVNNVTVNKTTNFKKKAKSKNNGKFKAACEIATPRKPKAGPTPDTECFFCKEKGHWKRNCKKYLEEKKKYVKSSTGIDLLHIADISCWLTM
jgi:hypothetical protein